MIFKFNTSVKTKKGEQLKPLTFLFFLLSQRVIQCIVRFVLSNWLL
ncbi:hypothetical protein VCRA2123O444_260018 [Vibrio crassostreae]|nr:hypothetical protein VCRA2113O416_230018 [Vibrio crassostreae]CAK1916209.1 hypothetical protein VCRA2110O182_210018 [Vibrio crassostreae]CAK1921835.1 hypothetical protein VCRA2117O428_240018 [Vibrio crassostreae]CAK1924946.1 hypothetical protein VCRA2118O429_230067 [Vibrio crassostreae]CAK1925179.1 hypothetical protein VCRA2113O413_240018 [Vibrio crassostreae]